MEEGETDAMVTSWKRCHGATTQGPELFIHELRQGLAIQGGHWQELPWQLTHPEHSVGWSASPQTHCLLQS